MHEIWERWKLCWDWIGRVVAMWLLGCISLYGFRSYLAGHFIGKKEFGHFLLGLVTYILS
jgi:hypothetical protein